MMLIFLLLYLKSTAVTSCLSVQKGCSVANYRYNQNCRAQIDNGVYPTNQNDGAYTGFLGSHLNAKAYSEHVGSSEYAKSDLELKCLSANNCTWQNTDEDMLDWVMGEGYVDPTKFELITGSNQFPGTYDQTFFMLASNPRPANHDGKFVSVVIGCQQSTGILSFRLWRSRARIFGQEPKLDICTRRALEETLDNCITVSPTVNHTIIASIPPILEPFVIVLRGYNFQNEPEGGLIIIDEIEYFAEFSHPENCASKQIDADAEIEPFNEATTEEPVEADKVVSGNTEEIEKPRVHSHDVVQQAAPTVLNDTRELIILNENSDFDCRLLQCLNNNNECDYKRTGEGAAGEGYYSGWRITKASSNLSNRLTGIRKPPVDGEDANFLLASFVGFQREPVDDRFVLEAPEFAINDSPAAYLSFRKYLYTKGLFLSICEDGLGRRCFWNVYEHSGDPFIGKWTKEVVLVPGNLTKFFIIAWQAQNMTRNFGQIGIAKIGMYSDAQALNPLC